MVEEMKTITIISRYQQHMFDAIISDEQYLKLKDKKFLQPKLLSSKFVPDGTGNDGKFLQIESIYEGEWVYFSEFNSVVVDNIVY